MKTSLPFWKGAAIWILALGMATAIAPVGSAGVVINEVRPWSGSTGVGEDAPSLFELYNADSLAETLGGWWGRCDAFSVSLPPWVMPAGTSLLVVLGTGTDDSDFSDSMATYYAGTIGNFEREAAELGLYNGAAIVDFVGWGQDTSTFGSAYLDALAAGIWPSGAFVDITNHTGFSHIALIPSGYDRNVPACWLELEQPYVVPLTVHNPIQLSPRDGSLLESVTELTWKAVAGVSSYFVEVDDDSIFGSPVYAQTVGSTSFSVSLSDGHYFWRVIPQGIGTHPAAMWDFTQAVPAVRGYGMTPVPQRFQHKDSRLLCIWYLVNNPPFIVGGTRPGCDESPGAEGPWDAPHAEGAHIPGCNHCNQYCTRASIQMVNAKYGGSLTQDEISYHLRENVLPGPEGDLGHGDGAWPQENSTYSWAMNNAAIAENFIGPQDPPYVPAPISWPTLTGEIDGGWPVITVIMPPGWFHTVVFNGYFEFLGLRFIHITDPWPGRTGWYRHDRMPCVRFYILPSGAIAGRAGDPNVAGVAADFDGDGVMNFDEGHPDPASEQVSRPFCSLWNDPDTDDDEVGDKQEIRSYTFHDQVTDHPGHENDALTFPDVDGDGLRAECDCDADNDGDFDGGEDINGDGRNPWPLSLSETCMYDASDWEIGVGVYLDVAPDTLSADAYLFGQTFHANSSYPYEVVGGCDTPVDSMGLVCGGPVLSNADGVIPQQYIGTFRPGLYRVIVDVLSDNHYSAPDNWDPWTCFAFGPACGGGAPQPLRNPTIIYHRPTYTVQIRWEEAPDMQSYAIYKSITDPFTGFSFLATVPQGVQFYADPIGADWKAFYYFTGVCDSFESGPSDDRVGFVKKTCAANAYTPFAEPLQTWEVVSGIPQYEVTSGKPSDVIGPQLTGGTGSTGDRAISMSTGWWAYRTTTAALWAGTLEDNSGMTAGVAMRLWNRHGSNQDMVLAGQVDTSTFGPIWIAPNAYTALSFRDARVRPIAQLNLLTSGFTGGSGGTSDRLIELGTGSYAYYATGSSSWSYNPAGFTSVSPGMAYRIWNRHGTGWNYNYGPGAVSRPPDRPGSNEGRIDVNRPPQTKMKAKGEEESLLRRIQ